MNSADDLRGGFGEANLEQALAEIGGLPERLNRYGLPTACYRGATALVFITSGSCVIKVVPASLGSEATESARREWAILESLKGCPRIVEPLDFVMRADTTTFLVERRYIPLSEYIRKRRLAEREICALGMDICQALIQCRRRGIYHLDIQPRNLFVDREGRGVLGDFGASAWASELKSVGLRGTRAYMAPEVLSHREYSERSEMYSLGLVLYCLLNGGAMPFSDRYASPDEVIEARLRGERLPRLSPEWLSEALEKACDPVPERRWECYEQFQNELAGRSTQSPDMAVRYRRGAVPGMGLISAGLGVIGAIGAGISAVGRFVRDAVKSGSKQPLSSFDESIPSHSSRPERGRPSAAGADTAQIDAMDGASGSQFDADPFATTMAEGPGRQFDADPFATTMAEGPGRQFDADPFATAISKDSGWQFDADPFATTMAEGPGRQFDLDSRAMSSSRMESASPGNAVAPKLDRVRFSAIAPKTLTAEEYSVIQVVMYEEAFRGAVDDIIASSEAPVSEKRSGFVEVARKTRVRVVLESPQFEIEDNVCEQTWCGGHAIFDFAVMLPASCAQAQILFKAAVYFDDVPAVRLMFTAKRANDDARLLEVSRRDIMSAFMSYASQDRRRVAEIIQGMQKIRPDLDIFFDVNNLRSGERWEQSLEQEILNRDMLYLCWSSNARKSKWVEAEWRLALEKKGEDFIEPLPLEGPDICPPPEELARKHFNDRLLYIINRN